MPKNYGIVPLLLLLLLVSACDEKQKKAIIIPNEILENEDIVLKCGYGPVSKMIVNTLGEEIAISHCAIICKEGDSTYVIHSVAKQVSNADGVQTLDFKAFLKDTKPETLFILRHKGAPEKRSALVNKAKHYLIKRVPFDHHYNLEDTTELYCSEFVYRACLEVYKENYLPIKQFPTGDEVLLFNPILKDEHFLMVYGNLN